MSESATPINKEGTVMRIGLMGGAYGNVPALQACLGDAASQHCTHHAFLGDAIGCCGHSPEILDLIRSKFDIVVAGNHEQQAATGEVSCGCGYSSPQDEQASCDAFVYACGGLSHQHRAWLATWPAVHRLQTPAGVILLCHGSPRTTNEFLYESEFDASRHQLLGLDSQVAGFVCTHSGLPWLYKTPGSKFAANCGVVGKPDHDGDTAVHYLILQANSMGIEMNIRRVVYNHQAWAAQLRQEGVGEIFIEPLLTGVWTVGVRSLPVAERPVQPRPISGGTELALKNCPS
ncbi:MAG: hypothetical protein HKL96_04430 [Phycisphaerales bacterium]|nr:hypothetical protein [Phycisphaerales bacterium]